MATPKAQVLIIGAGPTGLTLALMLAKMKIGVRIIDKAPGPGTTSRAVVVHARILEFYQQIGIAEEIINQGRKASAINLWVKGRKVAHLPLKDIGEGVSPFPFALVYPQDLHEKFLIAKLKNLGVEIEYDTEFIDFTEDKIQILAHIRKAGGDLEICPANFLAGCDGAHSKVRQSLKIDFPGGTYAHLFYVADARASGAAAIDGELHVALDSNDFLAVFPMPDAGVVRLIGALKKDPFERDNVEWNDVSSIPLDRLNINVEQVNWFSTYRVHHRVTEHFRKGPAFLLGDAAHIHSPVGGQGMNTGIGDAVNLAWKLAMVLKKQAAPGLLDSFEVERMAFARKLVETTDRAFSFVISRNPFLSFLRVHLIPKILPLVFKTRASKHFLFRTISQTAIHYRMSSLNEGQAGRLHAGDRLPWIKFDNGSDNFVTLTGLNWSIHIYGVPTSELTEICQQYAIPLHQFFWQPQMRKTGVTENTVYLVRPDGYLAFIDSTQSCKKLNSYLIRKVIGPQPF